MDKYVCAVTAQTYLSRAAFSVYRLTHNPHICKACGKRRLRATHSQRKSSTYQRKCGASNHAKHGSRGFPKLVAESDGAIGLTALSVWHKVPPTHRNRRANVLCWVCFPSRGFQAKHPVLFKAAALRCEGRRFPRWIDCGRARLAKALGNGNDSWARARGHRTVSSWWRSWGRACPLLLSKKRCHDCDNGET